jgi:hypothetical protein
MHMGGSFVADIDKLSKQIIDFAERLADVSDAAKGKGIRRRSIGTRWVLLPAAGAGIYALATSGSFARRTKSAVEQAKARASDLPEDLFNRVRQTSPTTNQNMSEGTGQSHSGTSKSGSGRRTTSSRRRSSGRKSASAR